MHADRAWSAGTLACEAAEIVEKTFQIGKFKLAVYLWKTWTLPQMRVPEGNVILILIWLRKVILFIFFIFFILTWIGGEKASQHVGHVTLSLRQGEGNHALPRFPSQIQYFLFLLVLIVCWENFKVYTFYITMAELVALSEKKRHNCPWAFKTCLLKPLNTAWLLLYGKFGMFKYLFSGWVGKW